MLIRFTQRFSSQNFSNCTACLIELCAVVIACCRRSRGSTPRGSRGGRGLGLGGGTGRGRGRGRGRGGRNKSPAPTADALDAELDAWKQVRVT